MSPRKQPTHGHPPAEGSGRASPRLRRTKEQRDQCAEQAYLLRVTGCLTFDLIAAWPDPTGSAATLYANASAARHAYLVHADRVRGTDAEHPLSVRERRALADDRYERLLRQWMPRAASGSESATMLVLRALAGQAELFGLKIRPAAPEVEDGPEDVADELAERRARSRAEARAAALRDSAAAAPAAATDG